MTTTNSKMSIHHIWHNAKIVSKHFLNNINFDLIEDPITENYRIVMCPTIDVIVDKTFEYKHQGKGIFGARGGFEWNFLYKFLPRFPHDLERPSRPFQSPVMAGGLFAISRKFFWELGAYDKDMFLYGKFFLCYNHATDVHREKNID